jgi:hypothetical protein
MSPSSLVVEVEGASAPPFIVVLVPGIGLALMFDW